MSLLEGRGKQLKETRMGSQIKFVYFKIQPVIILSLRQTLNVIYANDLNANLF